MNPIKCSIMTKGNLFKEINSLLPRIKSLGYDVSLSDCEICYSYVLSFRDNVLTCVVLSLINEIDCSYYLRNINGVFSFVFSYSH